MAALEPMCGLQFRQPTLAQESRPVVNFPTTLDAQAGSLAVLTCTSDIHEAVASHPSQHADMHDKTYIVAMQATAPRSTRRDILARRPHGHPVLCGLCRSSATLAPSRPPHALCACLRALWGPMHY